ncbi:MAG: O-sialoglycoprotein endopeptidase [Clostridiales bacterium]|nr:O-sialoglycoprotein endopeptidase [Clostridiales bacterium]
MILAFDTSCYTTSLALLGMDGRLLFDKRRLLPVKRGTLGLRQSDALFRHIQVIPELVKEALSDINELNVLAVAASTRPRPQEGSYMPVFLAGAQAAHLLSLAWSCPYLAYSHQEGHIAAALWSKKLNWQEPFVAAHLSGGTSEILLVKPHSDGFDLEILGGSDLPAGQFIDRVGVALGLPFPSGMALEQLALSMPPALLRLKGSLKGVEMSFSGPESAAQRLIAQGVEKAALAQAVFQNIAASINLAIHEATKNSKSKKVLITGGVAANSLIRELVGQESQDLDIHFADSVYAGDNAVGVAVLANINLIVNGASA